MRLPTRSVWIRFFAGALLGLLAMSLLAPGAVHASCGDYLTGNAHQAMPTTIGTAPNSTPVIPAPHRPCSGPNCSGRDSTPPLPPPAPAPVAGDDWGCAALVPLSQVPRFASWLLDSSTSLPVRRKSSIYHPPRLFSLFAI